MAKQCNMIETLDSVKFVSQFFNPVCSITHLSAENVTNYNITAASGSIFKTSVTVFHYNDLPAGKQHVYLFQKQTRYAFVQLKTKNR